MPERGNIINVMFMHGRDPGALKLYISVPRSDVESFLKKLAWSGDYRHLRWTIERAGPHETVFLDLSVFDCLSERIGVAVSQFHLLEGPHRDPRWSKILRDWVEHGLVPSEDANRLVCWPGAEVGVVSGEPTLCTRWLDLKLVAGERGKVQAKAYYGFRAERLPPVAAVGLAPFGMPADL